MSTQSTTDPDAMSLAVRGISKRYGATRALHKVDLNVRAGSVHALLGANGSGKSTLIKILAGVVQPSSCQGISFGTRFADITRISPALAHKMGMRFVHQQLGLFPELTVTENMAATAGFPTGPLRAIQWRALTERTDKLLADFGLPIRSSQRVSELRPTARTLLAIARVIGSDSDARLLILDEPTAALPDEDVKHLSSVIRTLSRMGVATVLVTHRLTEAAALADDVTILRDGMVVGTGPLADFPRQRMVEAISPSVALTSGSRGSGGGRSPDSAEAPRVVLQVTAVSARGLTDLDLCLSRGEIVGLGGIAGSGRSAILETLFGIRPSLRGTIRVSGRPLVLRSPQDALRAKIAYVPEDRSRQAIFSSQSVAINVTAATFRRFFRRVTLSLSARHEAGHADRQISRYAIKSESSKVTIGTLSGGNQQKAIIARWLDTEPLVLLLDEPTQGVDIGSRTDIHAAVRATAAAGAGVLLASSDLEELCELSDRIVLVDRGRVVAELPRPYTPETVGRRIHATS